MITFKDNFIRRSHPIKKLPTWLYGKSVMIDPAQLELPAGKLIEAKIVEIDVGQGTFTVSVDETNHEVGYVLSF